MKMSKGAPESAQYGFCRDLLAVCEISNRLLPRLRYTRQMYQSNMTRASHFNILFRVTKLLFNEIDVVLRTTFWGVKCLNVAGEGL